MTVIKGKPITIDDLGSLVAVLEIDRTFLTEDALAIEAEVVAEKLQRMRVALTIRMIRSPIEGTTFMKIAAVIVMVSKVSTMVATKMGTIAKNLPAHLGIVDSAPTVEVEDTEMITMIHQLGVMTQGIEIIDGGFSLPSCSKKVHKS